MINRHLEVSEASDDDLIYELARRQSCNISGINEGYLQALLTRIWRKKKFCQDYSSDLNEMIYYGLGKLPD